MIRKLGIILLLAATSLASEKPVAKADSVLVLKKERVLQLLKYGKAFKTYKVALGPAPVGPKTQQGDTKTPEGKYIIDSRNPQSAYHLSLHVSYPNAQDVANAKAKRVPRAATSSSTDCRRVCLRGCSTYAPRLDARLYRSDRC